MKWRDEFTFQDITSTRRHFKSHVAEWMESNGRAYRYGDDPALDLLILKFWGGVLRWVGIGYELSGDRERQQRDYEQLKALIELGSRQVLTFPDKYDTLALAEGRFDKNADGSLTERLIEEEVETKRLKDARTTASIRKGAGLDYIADDLL